nr:hypothetical protein [Tanacetum cinerariifolium]
MVLNINREEVDRVEQIEQHDLFRTCCIVGHKIFDVVIDGDSHENFITRYIVDQLNLSSEKHPLPYNLGKFKVTECCSVSFSIRKYKDKMLFDVVDTDACHIILGKPWVYDLNAVYKIEDNTYKFQHNGGHGIQKGQMVQNMEGTHGVKKHHVEFDYEEDDMFEFQQIVLFFLGGNSRMSFFKKGRMTQ